MQEKKRHRIAVLLLVGLLLTLTEVAEAAQPVPFGRITSVRGWRRDPFGSGRSRWHNGFDIAVPTGTPVNPTESGTVSFAGVYKGYGYLVAVDHGNGYVTMYGHLSRIHVRVGMAVTPRDVIALSGSTGRSTGPHLHYEIRQWPGAGTSLSPPEMANSAPSANHDDGWVDEQLGEVNRNAGLQAGVDRDGWLHGM
jgi:murein DD-endopeptidase MepM/ murein hydrolase activator NlpD